MHKPFDKHVEFGKQKVFNSFCLWYFLNQMIKV